MKIKTSELTGAALDWAVAKCEGWDVADDFWITDPGEAGTGQPLSDFRPSTDWAQGGPIIERKHINLSAYELPLPYRWLIQLDRSNGSSPIAPTKFFLKETSFQSDKNLAQHRNRCSRSKPPQGGFLVSASTFSRPGLLLGHGAQKSARHTAPRASVARATHWCPTSSGYSFAAAAQQCP